MRPDFFGSNALLGAVLFAQRDDPAAYPVLTHAHELEPGNEDVADLLFKVSLVLARERFQSKHYPECLEYLRKAAEVKPSDALVQRRLSEVYELVADSARAAQELQMAGRLESSVR